MALVAEYWGGFTGSKTFDILVNDQKLQQKISRGKRMENSLMFSTTYLRN
jgi:hypothetical protein